jgi:hypothetical protein
MLLFTTKWPGQFKHAALFAWSLLIRVYKLLTTLNAQESQLSYLQLTKVEKISQKSIKFRFVNIFLTAHLYLWNTINLLHEKCTRKYQLLNIIISLQICRGGGGGAHLRTTVVGARAPQRRSDLAFSVEARASGTGAGRAMTVACRRMHRSTAGPARAGGRTDGQWGRRGVW